METRNQNGRNFPQVSASEAATLVVQCADLTIELDDKDRVAQVFHTAGFDRRRIDHWIGRSLASIVAEDSQPKLAHLLADNAADPASEQRWRHLNLEVREGSALPLLLKFFAFASGPGAVRLLCARDLSPMVEAQARFQTALLRLEKDRPIARADLPAAKGR